jgi:antitoxin ParD1/3/4
MTIELSLSPKLEELVRSKVESGLYGSPAEVIEEALYVLDDYDQIRMRKLASLRKTIEDARNSGPPIPADEVFAELYEELHAVQK